MFLYVLIVCVTLLLYRLLRRHDRINLPGPTPWPIVGNLLQIHPDKPHLTLDKWHKQFNGVYKVNIAGETAVVVGDHEVIHEVLVKRGSDFSDRPDFYRLALYTDFADFRDGIVFSGPDSTWKMLRQVSHKMLKQYDTGLQRIEEVTLEVTTQLINDFRSQDGKYFEPRESITNAILNNIAVFLIGKQFSHEDEFFQKFREIDCLVMEVFSNTGKHALIDAFPWLRFFGNETPKAIEFCSKKLLELYEESKEAVREGSEDGSPAILPELLRLLKEEDVQGGEDRIIKTFGNLIFAGAGTSTSTLHALLNILSHNKDVQNKLQAELDDVIGTRTVTMQDRPNLPYVRATLFETLRYASITPTLVRRALRDSNIGDTRVPAGTNVFMNLYSNHHDKTYWNEPEKFKPERFLDDDGNLVPADHISRKMLFAFGAGTRVCIGEVFAMTRLFLMIASIVQNFDIEQAEPKIPCHPQTYDVSVVFCCPEYKIKMNYRGDAK